MLKKITTTELQVGMYLAKVGDKWIDSPFWRSSFLLTDPKDIQTLVEGGFDAVWIDTSKSLTSQVSSDQATTTQSNTEIITQHRMKEQAPDVKCRAETLGFGTALPVAPDEPRPAPLETERARAAAICGNSRRAMAQMFQELRLGKAVDPDKMLPVVEEISQSVLRNSDALIGLVRLKTKSDYTYMHSVAVCALMTSLARQLGMTEAAVREAGLAGLLHDIGKMAVPITILDKPGPLTDEEFRIMRTHSAAGHRLLSEASNVVPNTVLDVVLHHHEKIDGSGYPFGLANDQISRYARMGAICDVYDALTSDRPYKEGWCPTKAISQMATWKGHFDPVIFQAFVKCVGIYPVGTLVRLESGRLGIVLQQTEKSLLAPRVKIFFSTKSKTYISPEIIDLAANHTQDKITGWEDPTKWHFKNLESMWLHV